MERTTEFLIKELECASPTEANDRVFFVSALEVIHIFFCSKVVNVSFSAFLVNFDINVLLNEVTLGFVCLNSFLFST